MMSGMFRHSHVDVAGRSWEFWSVCSYEGPAAGVETRYYTFIDFGTVRKMRATKNMSDEHIPCVGH